ncbi:hypothetical protein Tco_1007864 [Tanacetum coccineum]
MKNVDSDSEVEDVVDDHAVFMASTGLKRGSDIGYGTNSLLEQWRTTKRDDDCDPYDDDLYESHDMSKNLQAICDDLDITVMDNQEKDKIESKTTRNEHGNEKSVMKSKSSQKVNQSQPRQKSKVKSEAENEKYLIAPSEPI